MITQELMYLYIIVYVFTYFFLYKSNNVMGSLIFFFLGISLFTFTVGYENLVAGILSIVSLMRIFLDLLK